MPDIKRILCPVDFSQPSQVAAGYAVDLAKTFGAELHLVHVYQLPVYAFPDGAVMAGPDFTIEVTTGLTRALDNMARDHADEAGQEPKTHLVEGVAYNEIVRLTDELDCDMVVMGTHGRTGVKHMLLGSVAERVVRRSKVPVVVVPAAE